MKIVDIKPVWLARIVMITIGVPLVIVLWITSCVAIFFAAIMDAVIELIRDISKGFNYVHSEVYPVLIRSIKWAFSMHL